MTNIPILYFIWNAFFAGFLEGRPALAAMENGMMGEGTPWMMLLCIIGIIIGLLLIVLLVLLIFYLIKKLKQ